MIPQSLRIRGFTLIELLVVIAIIGILSSVVLASLNTARNKGADAAIKADLAGSRAQAELYYSENGNKYDGVCAAANGLLKHANGARSAGSSLVVCNDNAVLSSSTQYWAMSARLLTNSSQYWCVDYTGTSTLKQTSGLTSASLPFGEMCATIF